MRWRDPVIGRWISREPTGIKQPWKTRQAYKSLRFTTQPEELLEVRV